jgi:hypothetical protein
VKHSRVALAALVLSVVIVRSSAAGVAVDVGRVLELKQRGAAPTSPLRFVEGVARSAPTADNFEILSHLRFEGLPPDADIAVFDHGPAVGTFAYVGSTSFECGDARGVSIVDVTDPENPSLVAHASAGRNTTTEDVSVERIGDRIVLGVGFQVCGPRSKAGLGLFDVTDPRKPRKLSTLPQPAGGVHELDLVTRSDGVSLALLAVPFAEADTIFSGQDFGGDFRIVDVTDPTKPVELTNWGVVQDSDLYLVRRPQPVGHPFHGLGELTVHFAHSARVADEGMTAYVSYWDGGVLKFDISDPSQPTLLGRTRYPIEAEGEAHSMTPYDFGGERYIFQADEDPRPTSPVILTSNVTGSTRYQGIDEFWMPTTLAELGSLTGAATDAGDGCQTEDFATASGRIVLADLFAFGDDPPPCGIGGIVKRAANAGADAVVLNYVGPDDPFAFPPGPRKQREIARIAEGMPVVVVAAADGLVNVIRTTASPIAPEVTMTAQKPSYGFLRVFTEQGATDVDGDGFLDFPQVGLFDDLPHVTGDLTAGEGFTWTIHNPEVSGNRLYASWYGHGIVALDISDPVNPRQVGQFVPSTSLRSRYFSRSPYALTWGVAIHDGLVYASDLRSGLWIVRPTGEAVGTSVNQ